MNDKRLAIILSNCRQELQYVRKYGRSMVDMEQSERTNLIDWFKRRLTLQLDELSKIQNLPPQYSRLKKSLINELNTLEHGT